MQGRSVGLLRGAAWGCAGAQQRGAAQGRSSVGLCRGATARPVQERSSVGVATWGFAGAQQRGAALERSVGLRRGAAAWGCVGAQQRGAAQGRSVGLRLGCTLRKGVVWGCAGAQRGAA